MRLPVGDGLDRTAEADVPQPADRGVPVDVGAPGPVPREGVERVENQLAAAPVHGQLEEVAQERQASGGELGGVLTFETSS